MILVNRKLDRDDSSGLEVVSELIGLNPQMPVMLVSDFKAVQDAAVQAGALPGFGKSDLESTETLKRLAETVRSAPAKSPRPNA